MEHFSKSGVGAQAIWHRTLRLLLALAARCRPVADGLLATASSSYSSFKPIAVRKIKLLRKKKPFQLIVALVVVNIVYVAVIAALLGARSSRGHLAMVAVEPEALQTLPEGYGGVSRYEIAVSISAMGTERPFAATVQLFIKALVTPENTTTVRAVVLLVPELQSYGDATGRGEEWARDRVTGPAGSQLSAPELAHLELALESPSLRLRNLLEVSTYPCVGPASRDGEGERCAQAPTDDLGRPVRSGEIRFDFGARARPQDDWRISIGGSGPGGGAYVPLDRVISRARASRAPSSPPRIVHVTPPAILSNFSPRALRHIAAYHANLGTSGTIAYATDDVLAAAERDPGLSRLAKHGALRLVRWPRPLRNGTTMAPDTDAIASHAVLSFWGSGSRLLLADTDELLALPARRMVLRALTVRGGCLSAACSTLPRFDAYVSQGGGGDPASSATWLDGGSATRAASSLAWRERRRDVRGRILVDPDRVSSVHLADAALCVGPVAVLDPVKASYEAAEPPVPLASPCSHVRRCTDVAPDCSYVLHHANLLTVRKTPVDVIQDKAWMWVL